MADLTYNKRAFNSVGWFIPPYLTLAFIDTLAKEITDAGSAFSQRELEAILAHVYSPEHLAAMVTSRYPVTPYVQEYALTISEAVEAHFLKLDHVAIAGLMPVIEGAGRKLAESRSVSRKDINGVFSSLAKDCKKEALEKGLGAVDEVVAMLESFLAFTREHLYVDSSRYAHADKTNRHGILHGAYTDEDYGAPINFYKAIGAVDFLCFVSAFRASISWFAPNQTPQSRMLAGHYRMAQAFSARRPLLAKSTGKRSK